MTGYKGRTQTNTRRSLCQGTSLDSCDQLQDESLHVQSIIKHCLIFHMPYSCLYLRSFSMRSLQNTPQLYKSQLIMRRQPKTLIGVLEQLKHVYYNNQTIRNIHLCRLTKKEIFSVVSIQTAYLSLWKKRAGSSLARSNQYQVNTSSVPNLVSEVFLTNLKPQSSIKRRVLHGCPKRLKGYDMLLSFLDIPNSTIQSIVQNKTIISQYVQIMNHYVGQLKQI